MLDDIFAAARSGIVTMEPATAAREAFAAPLPAVFVSVQATKAFATAVCSAASERAKFRICPSLDLLNARRLDWSRKLTLDQAFDTKASVEPDAAKEHTLLQRIKRLDDKKVTTRTIKDLQTDYNLWSNIYFAARFRQSSRSSL